MRSVAVLAACCAAVSAATAPAAGTLMCVEATAGLHLRRDPCTNGSIVSTAPYSEALTVTESGTVAHCGLHWIQVDGSWADAQYLYQCGGPHTNKFGIGLVSPGNTEQWDFAHSLAGDGGWIMLLFPGVDSTSTAPQPAWVQALNAAYDRNLSPVVRLSPPWGQAHYRSESDDAGHLNYTTLAQAFKAVVAGLPMRPGVRVYFQIDNEPDLCYEWSCSPAGPPLNFKTMATEYGALYTYVATALRSLGDTRIKVAPAAMSPGSAATCGCCGSSNCPADKGGATGLQYQQAALAAWPHMYELADFLATHSYPATGIGYGFNAPMPAGAVGLQYYQHELQVIGRSLPVMVTETGWATKPPGGNPPCTEAQKAAWTIDAYAHVFYNDTRVAGVMPFMLQGPQWGTKYGYEYVTMSNTAVDVFSAVQRMRCAKGFNSPPC